MVPSGRVNSGAVGADHSGADVTTPRNVGPGKARTRAQGDNTSLGLCRDVGEHMGRVRRCGSPSPICFAAGVSDAVGPIRCGGRCEGCHRLPAVLLPIRPHPRLSPLGYTSHRLSIFTRRRGYCI